MNEKSWVSHFEWCVLLVTLIGGFYTLDGKIERGREECIQLCMQQSQRIDRQYEMFYEVVREKNAK